MKILSLNCWGRYGPPERQEVLLDSVRHLNADILCLQETPDPTFLKSLNYPVWFHAADTGLAVASRFPSTEHRSFLYKTRSPVETAPRGALFGELLIGTKRFWVGSTHFSWKEEDEASRIGQTKNLIKIIRNLKGDLLLGGDFNASADSLSVRMLREEGLRDLFAHLHPADPGITWDNANPFIQSHSVQFPDRRIDFIFLRTETAEERALSSCEVVCRRPSASEMLPSDHYGILATFSSG